MKRLKLLIILALMSLNLIAQSYNLQVVAEINLGVPIGQLRAVPLNMGNNQPRAVVAMYSEDAEIDPYIGMFFFLNIRLK